MSKNKNTQKRITVDSLWNKRLVDKGFCSAQSHSQSVPKKHPEVYINYKLAQASY